MMILDRLILVVAALCGLAGVGLAAYAAHVQGAAGLATAANMLLFHAPALMLAALLSGLNATNRLLTRLAALALIAGLVLFSGSIALRTLAGIRMISNSAPIGGIALMGGWAILALAALLKGRR